MYLIYWLHARVIIVDQQADDIAFVINDVTSGVR
jgi:hypothetical protein